MGSRSGDAGLVTETMDAALLDAATLDAATLDAGTLITEAPGAQDASWRSLILFISIAIFPKYKILSRWVQQKRKEKKRLLEICGPRHRKAEEIYPAGKLL